VGRETQRPAPGVEAKAEVSSGASDLEGS
jgi:hypothetical protein